jgi:biotin carboxyl carrier protein
VKAQPAEETPSGVFTVAQMVEELGRPSFPGINQSPPKRSSPDAPPFVTVNDTVKKGDVLCIIEAMKLMNEIEAEISGTIVEVLVENGQAVEYDQPLFRIKP